MADLRDRIRTGELAAFDDKALPLHLLSEPDATWFWIGVQKVLFVHVLHFLPDEERVVRLDRDDIDLLERKANVSQILNVTRQIHLTHEIARFVARLESLGVVG